MKRALPLACALSACQQYTPPGAYDAWQLCLTKHGATHEKVSAARAHAIVDQCEPELRRLALRSVQQAYCNEFSLNNRHAVEEYASLKAIFKERELLQLSDDIKPTFYVM